MAIFDLMLEMKQEVRAMALEFKRRAVMNFHDDVPFEFEKVTVPPFNDLDIDTHKVLVTFFADMQAQGRTPGEMPLPWLAEMIGQETALSKMELPWLKLQSFGDKASDRFCLRNDANVLEISGIEIEHDAGEISFETAIATMRTAKIRCLLYTSPSWVEGVKEKWRILLPTSKRLPPEAHARLLPRANGVFEGKISGECFTLSQAYLFGHLVGAAHREVVLDGDFIDSRDDLDAGAMVKQKHQVNLATGATSLSGAYTKEELVDNILRGGPLHESLAGLSAKLAASGMKEEAIITYLQDLMTRSKAPTDQRWHERHDDIPRLAESAVTKYGRDPNKDWSKTLLGDWLRERRAKYGDAGFAQTINTTGPGAASGGAGGGGAGSGTGSAPGAAPGTASAGPGLTATPYVWIDPDKLPMRDWLYGRLLVRKFVSLTASPGGTGKSSLITAETMAQVSGRSLLGIQPKERLRVWLWNLEDPQEETQRKIQATAKHYRLKEADIGDRLFVDSGRDQPLVIATMDKNGAVIARPVVDALVAEIVAKQVDIIVIDPFVSCHEVPENDNSAQDMIVKEWGKVADRGNCAVHLVDHTRKTPPGTEITTDSARGGKAKTDAARVVRVVNPMTKDEAAKAGVENHRLFFRTYNDKANLAPPAESSDWFRLESVDLGNNPAPPMAVLGDGTVFKAPGDNIGVVTLWSWPNPLEGVTPADFQAAAVKIQAGVWRESSQCKDWVGVPIADAMGLELTDPSAKAKVKGLIKIWLAEKRLVEVTRKDAQRKSRKYVEVAEVPKGGTEPKCAT